MPNLLASVLRVYCFVFHLTLGIFLMSSVAIAYYAHKLSNLDMLPFANETLLRNTLWLGLFATVCPLLALTRGFKFIFLLWTIVVVYLMVKWFFLNDYIGDNAVQSRVVSWLTYGSIGALGSAWWSLRSRRRLPLF